MREREEVVTSDLAQFGSRERKMLEDLLRAWRKHGLPRDFDGDGVTAAMNRNSGCVFLTNANYDVAMEEDGRLVSFYSCPQCGEEGTWDDSIKDHGNDGGECGRWVDQLRAARED